MGQGDTETALKVPGVKLVAAADIYDGRFAQVREKFGKDVQTTRDYREILDRDDIDAVIVASPDHWHMQMTIDALEKGKDVYCEKPMMHTIEQGRRMVEAEKKTGRILQVGSQMVSSIVVEKARDLFASGALGEVNLIEGWTNRNSVMGALHWPIPEDASPETIDWDRFLGHAPKVPFEPARLFRWRLYKDYGTSISGDLFVHLFSGMHVVTGALGPTRVFCSGGLRYWKDGREIPDVMIAVFDYPAAGSRPGFNLTLKVNFVDGSVVNEWGDTGFRFVGNEGVMDLGGRGDRSRSARRSPATGTPRPRRASASPSSTPTPTPRPTATTPASTTSGTSSRPAAPASRSSRTPPSACGRPRRRCCATRATTRSASSAGTRDLRARLRGVRS